MVTILDLFCGAGGAAMGLHRAGHKVVGVDIEPQPNYPFEFIRADALSFDLEGYDVYWASPPCQAYSRVCVNLRNAGNEYPDLIGATRQMLNETGKPYIIENVEGAPLRRDIMLCGMMFNLKLIRHRLFEIHGFHVQQPFHRKHKPRIKSPNGKTKGRFCTVAGQGHDGFSNKISDWKIAMGIDWMTKKELTQAVPPAYAEYIGQFIK